MEPPPTDDRVPERPLRISVDRRPLRPNSARLSDRLAAELEQEIVLGHIGAGTPLPTEAELGDIFGVSRTAVRDGIRLLVARGLIDVQAGRGTTVLPATDDSLSRALLILLIRSEITMGEVMDARAAIETELVPLAAERATTEQRAAVTRELERFERAAERRDWLETNEAHLAFHLALLRATDLPALALLLRPLQQVILVCSQPVRVDSRDDWDIAHHRAIREALQQSDPELLRDAMRQHFAFFDHPSFNEIRAQPFRESKAVKAALLRELSGEPWQPTT